MQTERLFLRRDDRVYWDDYLTRALAEAGERVRAGAVMPWIDFEAFRSRLAEIDFRTPVEADDILRWTIAQLETGITHITSPRYFGLFNPGPTAPAQWADRIAATFNPQLATWTTSPAAVEIEAHTIRAVAARAGFPAGAAGHFTTGGAEANYTALICALTAAEPAFAIEGARAFDGKPVFYISKESHLAWLKIGHQAGVGRSAARLVATDGTGRMDAKALRTFIDADIAAGCVPVMIVATAGTTNAGMVDPLHECRRIADEAGVWMHVDAAWGGAAIASPARARVLSGIELADSLTIDAHKWFATTMGCGMFITRHPEILTPTFAVSTGYMPSSDHDRDPYTMSVQWSRRFLGLRLFLSLAVGGWDDYAAHVEHAVEMTGLLAKRMTGLGWGVVNASDLAVLCLRPPRGDALSVVAKVLATGRAWVSVATFEGQQVVRACVTHGETTPEDVALLADLLAAA